MISSLATLLADVAAGCPPAPDGRVTVLPPPSLRDSGVLAFTAHHVVFADVTTDWVQASLPDGDPLAAPVSARFLTRLEDRLHRRAGLFDLLAVAPSRPGPAPLELVPDDGRDHPRVLRVLRYRDEVTVWTGAGATVTIGRGVAGRYEVAIEVDPAKRNQGLGRRAALAARYLVPAGASLWAQIAPGNAASVRAFLAAGYVPVGAEVLLTRD